MLNGNSFRKRIIVGCMLVASIFSFGVFAGELAVTQKGSMIYKKDDGTWILAIPTETTIRVAVNKRGHKLWTHPAVKKRLKGKTPESLSSKQAKVLLDDMRETGLEKYRDEIKEMVKGAKEILEDRVKKKDQSQKEGEKQKERHSVQDLRTAFEEAGFSEVSFESFAEEAEKRFGASHGAAFTMRKEDIGETSVFVLVFNTQENSQQVLKDGKHQVKDAIVHDNLIVGLHLRQAEDIDAIMRAFSKAKLGKGSAARQVFSEEYLREACQHIVTAQIKSGLGTIRTAQRVYRGEKGYYADEMAALDIQNRDFRNWNYVSLNDFGIVSANEDRFLIQWTGDIEGYDYGKVQMDERGEIDKE